MRNDNQTTFAAVLIGLLIVLFLLAMLGYAGF